MAGRSRAPSWRGRTVRLSYASPALISVRHEFYANEGGAHGNYGTTNYNIDMASGRLIGIADVLAEPSAAILTLWCKTQIEAEKQKRVPGIDLAEGAAERDKAIAAQVRDLAELEHRGERDRGELRSLRGGRLCRGRL